MRNVLITLTLIASLVIPGKAKASVTLFDEGVQIGHVSDLEVGTNFTAAIVNGKGKITLTQNPIGLMQNIVTTSGDLSVSQCGSTVTSTLNRSRFVLPSISNDSALGCRFTFIVLKTPTSGTNQGLIVDVDTLNEKILQLTDTLGDSISADLSGDAVVLEAFSNSSSDGYFWAPVSVNGTWTDQGTN